MTPPGGGEVLHPADPRRAAAPPPSATRSLRPARQRDCHPSAPELLDRQPVAARRAFCTNAYPAIAHPARRSWLNPRIGRTRLQPAVVRLEAIAGVQLGSMPGHWRQLALGDPAGHVAPGRLMPAQPHDHDPVQCRVGLAVTAPVEPVPHGLPEDASTGRRTASKRNWKPLSPCLAGHGFVRLYSSKRAIAQLHSRVGPSANAADLLPGGTESDTAKAARSP
jgi:hypothetical protein